MPHLVALGPLRALMESQFNATTTLCWGGNDKLNAPNDQVKSLTHSNLTQTNTQTEMTANISDR